MRTTQSLVPQFHEVATLPELPVTGGIDARAVNDAIKLARAHQTMHRVVATMRYAQVVQREFARQAAVVVAAPSPAESLKSSLRRLFMATMAYYHAHLDAAMPDQVSNALRRVYQASQGGLVQGHVLFVDLRQLGACEAICEPLVEAALVEAEQALCAMKMG